MTEAELFAYEKVGEGIRIWSCFSYAHEVVLPESLEGQPVTELAAYACSAHMEESCFRQLEREGRLCLGTREGKRYSGIWAEGTQEQGRPKLPPRVCGSDVEAVSLPSGLKKIGNYAFYNCDRLGKLGFFAGISDLGAGLFTGCHHVRELDVTVRTDQPSCLREVLTELSEALRVDYREPGGYTRLLFSEFYEEGVENTPARILMTQVHGSGLFFRNCFRETQFQFSWYDERFDLARFQEDAGFVLELALSRLRYPYKLGDQARTRYEGYVREHFKEAGSWLLEGGKLESQGSWGNFSGESQGKPELVWLLEEPAFRPVVTAELLTELIREAQERQQWEMISYLMDFKGRHFRPRMPSFDL